MPTVDILMPHFKTLHLTAACLRDLMEHTNPAAAQIVVIDNGDSEGWLEGVSKAGFIRLIADSPTLPPPTDRFPGWTVCRGAGEALDWGLAESTAEFCVTLHTDCFIRRNDWLEHLLSLCSGYAAVGAALYPATQLWMKGIVEGTIFPEWSADPDIRRWLDESHYWPHPSISIWRTETIKDLVLSGFGWAKDGEGYVLATEVRRHGGKVHLLPAGALDPYAQHIGGATFLLVEGQAAHPGSLVRPIVDWVCSDTSVGVFWAERGCPVPPYIRSGEPMGGNQ